MINSRTNGPPADVSMQRDIHFSAYSTSVSGVVFMMYAQRNQNGKPNNFKFCWSKKQDSQSRLKFPMIEGGETYFSLAHPAW